MNHRSIVPDATKYPIPGMTSPTAMTVEISQTAVRKP